MEQKVFFFFFFFFFVVVVVFVTSTFRLILWSGHGGAIDIWVAVDIAYILS